MAIFSNGFGRFVCQGDKIAADHAGFKLTATIHDDDNSDAPWESDDGHGPVSDWRRKDSKKPGERILNTDRNSARFYDFAEACKIALRDGWGPREERAGESRKARAARAAQEDYEALRAWCNDEWRYVGIDVRVAFAGIELVGRYDVAVWGIEANYPGSDNSYLTETAEELAADAIAAARANMKALCHAPRPATPRPEAPERVQALRTRLATLATRRPVARPAAGQGGV